MRKVSPQQQERLCGLAACVTVCGNFHMKRRHFVYRFIQNEQEASAHSDAVSASAFRFISIVFNEKHSALIRLYWRVISVTSVLTTNVCRLTTQRRCGRWSLAAVFNSRRVDKCSRKRKKVAEQQTEHKMFLQAWRSKEMTGLQPCDFLLLINASVNLPSVYKMSHNTKKNGRHNFPEPACLKLADI